MNKSWPVPSFLRRSVRWLDQGDTTKLINSKENDDRAKSDYELRSPIIS